MLGIVLNLPPAVEHYINATPVEVMAAHALLIFGWFPIFAVLVWGMAHVWLDFKQEKYAHHRKYVLLEVRVPQMAIQTPKGMDLFFTNLAGARSSITWKERWLLGKEQAVFSFEIVSNGGQVQFMIRCVDSYRDLVEADLYAQYPEAQITEVPDYAKNIPQLYPDSEWESFGAEFVLKNAQYLPIKTYEDFEHQGEKENRFKDPLFPILEIMGKMRPDENFWMQILIQQPDDQNWAKEGAKYTATVMGKEEKKHKTMMQEFGSAASALPLELVGQLTGIGGGAHPPEKKADDFRVFKLTPGEKNQLDAVTDKIAKIGWYTKIRVLYSAKKTKFRKGMMAAAMKGMMHSYTNSSINQFGMHNPSIPKDDYFWMEWSYAAKQTRLTRRYAARSFGAGASLYILNTEELATLWHFPAADARTPVLSALGARRAEAPSGLYFAEDTDGDGIPDWKQKHGRFAEPSKEELASAQVQLPSPHAPTGGVGEAPLPGRPAPLPPGLDLSDEPLDPRGVPPGNLPV